MTTSPERSGGHSNPRKLVTASALKVKIDLVLRPSIAIMLAGSQEPELGRRAKEKV